MVGSNLPPGAANDPRAPYNQEPVEECELCGGSYTEDGHEPLDGPEQQCRECGAYREGEDLTICPECGCEEMAGLPCPNSGMDMHDLEEAERARHAEHKMEQRRFEERMNDE